ncbi:MAG: hypothetical protein Q9166_001457 [cf. Caloplaca sp. 2 TL-2023]
MIILLPSELRDEIWNYLAVQRRFVIFRLTYLYKKGLDLAALLGNAKQGLPNLEINLVDSASAKWSSRGGPQRSVFTNPKRHYLSLFRTLDPYEDEGRRLWRLVQFLENPERTWTLDQDEEGTGNTDDDDHIVLKTFIHLRNARSARISESGDRRDNLFHNVAKTLRTYTNSDDAWNDAGIQEDTDDIYVQMDLDVDLLLGPTASMMRLDRFSSWYTDMFRAESKYKKEFERIIMASIDYDIRS